MSLVLPLPPELVNFLSLPPPETLVVSGPAGSGKTTLALALLGSFRGNKLYVSSRVEAKKLNRNYPWLGVAESKDVTVVDATDWGTSLRDSARLLEYFRSSNKPGGGVDESMRAMMPAPFREATELARRGTPSMLVVDSWTAVVDRFLDAPRTASAPAPAREEVERLVLTRLSTGPFHVVLVLERNDPSALDYIVDGVVRLEKRLVDERGERWLHLEKLRGIRLNQALYPFTLEGARFQCITPVGREAPNRLRPPEPEPVPPVEGLWPGNAEFAEQFGNLPTGLVCLIERDPDVPDGSINLVLGPIIAQVLGSGGRVFHVLGPRTQPKSIWESCKPLMTHEKFVEQVRILTPAAVLAEPDPDLKGVVLPLPRKTETPVEARVPEAVRFLREGAQANLPGLIVVWASGLATLGALTGAPYRPETLPLLMLDYASGANTYGVFIGQVDTPLVDSLRAVSPLRLHFRARAGRVFVYGKHPVTPSFVLIEGTEDAPYRLLRVV